MSNRMCGIHIISDTCPLGSLPQAAPARGQTLAAATALLATLCIHFQPFPVQTPLFRVVALFRAQTALRKHAFAAARYIYPDASVFDALVTSFNCGHWHAQGLNKTRNARIRAVLLHAPFQGKAFALM